VHHDGAPTPQPVVVCRFYKAWTFSVSEGKTAKKVASYSMQAIANYLNYHQLVQNLASLDFSELNYSASSLIPNSLDKQKIILFK